MAKITSNMVARSTTKTLEALMNDPRVEQEELDMIANELDMRYQEAHEARGGMGGY